MYFREKTVEYLKAVAHLNNTQKFSNNLKETATCLRYKCQLGSAVQGKIHLL
jgi:hypothetical protein